MPTTTQHHPVRCSLLLALLALMTLSGVPAFSNQTQSSGTRSQPGFQQVANIFQEKCVVCHNHTTRKGDLNLESYEGLMTGGKRGVSIIPGKSSESLLVKMIEGAVKPRMPLGDELRADEIKLIKTWIDSGAFGPDAATTKTETVSPASTRPIAIPDIKPKTQVKAAISSLAFSKDNSLIAVGGYQEVELLNAQTGQTVAKLSGHANQVRSVAFSPANSSGRQLLAAAGGNPSQFGEVKIWDVATRKELLTIRGHRDNIFAIAFSPDGKALATCSYDKIVKLWDVATGSEIKNLKDHTDAVFSVAFSPDGKLLASASADRTLKIWDVATGIRLYTLSDALDSVNSIAFSPSGKLLAGAGADRIIRLWEIGATEGRQVKSLIAHEDAINVIAFSPDGKTLASAAADKSLKLWDAAKLEELHSAEKQSDWIFSLGFSSDGKRLAVGRYDGSIGFYDPATGRRM
ncbi:MAG: PD40 domain-containing protein [Acidobacteria bacterium]|nr:PD40 domain-containing protein [Acidobacteriota bacterium]